MGMPSPDSDGWDGWVRHWLASNVVPLWLNETAVEHRMRLPDLARLGWRLRAAEAASLERSVSEGGTLRRSLRDAGVSDEVADQVVGAVEEDVVRRRRTLERLAAVGRHL